MVRLGTNRSSLEYNEDNELILVLRGGITEKQNTYTTLDGNKREYSNYAVYFPTFLKNYINADQHIYIYKYNNKNIITINKPYETCKYYKTSSYTIKLKNSFFKNVQKDTILAFKFNPFKKEFFSQQQGIITLEISHIKGVLKQ